MKTRGLHLLFITYLMCLTSIVLSQSVPISGIIVDKKGVQTKVNNISHTVKQYGNNDTRYIPDAVRFDAINFVACVPLSNIISIQKSPNTDQKKDDKLVMKFYWHKKEVTIVGKGLDSPGAFGTFTGKSEFGEFTLSASNLSSFINDNPQNDYTPQKNTIPELAKRIQDTSDNYSAVITFTNGSKLSIRYLERYDRSSYNSHPGWTDGRMVYNDRFFDDIIFFRGNTESSVLFSNMRSLKFINRDSQDRDIFNLMLTLKSGTESPGTIYLHNPLYIEGKAAESFAAMSELGEILIPSSAFNTIDTITFTK